MSRVFLTRVQATYALGLLCSSQKREPAGVVVACRDRATGEVHEAQGDEALHAQIALRVGVYGLEDGWTVPAGSRAAAAASPPPAG